MGIHQPSKAGGCSHGDHPIDTATSCRWGNDPIRIVRSWENRSNPLPKAPAGLGRGVARRVEAEGS